MEKADGQPSNIMEILTGYIWVIRNTIQKTYGVFAVVLKIQLGKLELQPHLQNGGHIMKREDPCSMELLLLTRQS